MTKTTTRKTGKLPSYSESRGWRGGDGRTLYAFTCSYTGRTTVCPVWNARSIGPSCTVRVATRDEALVQWQNPLHAGWRVVD